MDKSPDEPLSKTLLCKNIPQSLVKRQTLKTHFEKFGTVLKVQTNAEKGAALVEFETHEQAANARKLGTAMGAHQIQLIWKKRSARSSSSAQAVFSGDSPIVITKAKPTRSSLFGKALVSATGKSVGARPPTQRTLSHKNESAKAIDVSFAGAPLHQAAGSPTGAPLHQAAGSIKRELPTDGLYDDLPPPSAWSEETDLRHSKKRVVSQSKETGNIHSKPIKSRISAGTGLFGKKRVIKEEPQPPQKETVFAKVLPGKESTIPTQPTSAQAPPFEKTKVAIASGGEVLFGKPVMAKPATERSNPFGISVLPKTVSQSPGPAGVVLFGKKLSTAPDKSTISQPTNVSKAEDTQATPSLFGKSSARRSMSPKPTVKDRLSPAVTRPRRSASVSPPPSFRQRLPLASRRSPSPAPAVSVVPQENAKEADRALEWIMPPSLAVLKQTPAYTCSERQSLLDKREKIVRQGMNKESDLSKAKATAGCCPDMCPEKERYTREDRRQVHIYEMLPNTESHPQIDHSIAVKEYSRSSADQEEPLPLELRPAHVLSRTMDYLCNNILDIGSDATWADWFDFLWNRTRAIRKDITQQHLCDPVTAGLVEKCVRFHIYCGARLVEEKPEVFDPKINDENLTKCLQTLKEMYDDLLKRGVECSKEAEFRAYLVLMNLNEGDTLREVQQLRPAIRSSREIKFALSAYSALCDNNYVKFFGLVSHTTFLNACILHRYFNQIRNEALKVILRAYSAPKGPAQVTVNKLFDMLHFESEQEGNAFLEHYGISTNSAGLSKESFVEPEAPLAVKRSLELVEGKLTTTLGEAVYGEPLPPNVILQPSSSFDQGGVFIGIIKPPQVALPDAGVTPREATVRLPPFDQIPDQVVKDSIKVVMLDVLNKDTKSVVEEFMMEEKKLRQTAERDMHTITEQVIHDLCKDIAQELIKEAKKEREKRAKAAKLVVINQICSEFVDNLVERVGAEESKAVAVQVYRGVQEELLERQRIRCANAVGTELIHSYVVSFVEEVAKEVYESDVTNRILELEEAERKTKILLCRRVFQQWMAVYKKRTHLKRAMIEFPAAPPMLPLKRSKEFKVTSETVQLGKRSRLSVGPPGDLNKRLGLVAFHRKISLMLSNAPLNMSTVLTSALADDNNAGNYMKLLLLHADGECAEDRQLSVWLNKKLSVGSVPAEKASVSGKLLSHYSVTIGSDQSASRKFAVCIRSCLSPPSSVGLQQSFYGANMAMVLLPYKAEPNESYWHKLRTQLSSFVHEKPALPAIPLLIISPLHLPKETVQYEAGVYELMDQRLISHIRVERVDNTVEFNEQLAAGMEWLVSHRPPKPDVELTEVRSLLETYLTSTFYAGVYQDLASRQQQDFLHLSPEDLIAYFNDTIVRLGGVICDEALADYSWPIYENNSKGLSLEECRYLIYERIQLPEFSHHHKDGWYHACTDVMSYLDKVIEHYLAPSQYTWICRQHETAPALYASVKASLAKAEATFTYRCERQFHAPPRLEPQRQNVPWLHIIVACVEVGLSTIDSQVLAMHRPYSGRLECPPALNCTGDGVPYVDTLAMAMVSARPNDADDIDIDLEKSIYSEPVHALSTSVCEELNASKRFEEFLISQLGEEISLAETAPAQAANNPDNISNSHSDLSELIRKERRDTEEFEQFLYQSLLEQT